MKIYLLLPIFLFFCVGCALNVNKNKSENEILIGSSHAVFFNNGQRILLMGSYLGKYDEMDKFIINIYPQNLDVNLSSFKLNGTAAKSVKSNDDNRSLNVWGREFIVNFARQKNIDANVSLEIYPSIPVWLNLQKDRELIDLRQVNLNK